MKCNARLLRKPPSRRRAAVAFTTHKEFDMRTAAILTLGVIGLAGCEPIATEDTPVPSTTAPSTSGRDERRHQQHESNPDARGPRDAHRPSSASRPYAASAG